MGNFVCLNLQINVNSFIQWILSNLYAGCGDRAMNTDFQHSSIVQSSSGGKDNSDHNCNEYF